MAQGPAASPPVPEHVLPGIGGMATVDRLSALSGSDFTSVMLEIARRRAAETAQHQGSTTLANSTVRGCGSGRPLGARCPRC